jgi:hypothetical protein
VCIPSLREGKDGDYVLVRRFWEDLSLCSISDKSSQLTQSLVGLKSSSIANPHAPILWRLLREKLLILPTKAILQDLLIIHVSPAALLKNGMS